MRKLQCLFLKWWKTSALFAVCVSPIPLFFLLAGQRNQAVPPEQKSTNWQSPSVQVLQLPPEDGIIPVEIRRAKAHFNSPNEIEDFTLVIKNNIDKNISAISVRITITAESEGEKFVKTNFLSFDYFIHQDIVSANKIKPFLAKDVEVLESASMTFSHTSVIKAIAVKIDYVEFSDGMSLEVNKDGGHIIRQMRIGAAKYKAWLTEKYRQSGRSITSIISSLDDSSPSTDLKLGSDYQNHGARAYQKYLKDIYIGSGADAVMKYFVTKPN